MVNNVLSAAAKLPAPSTREAFEQDRTALHGVVATALRDGRHVAHMLQFAGNIAVLADVIAIRHRQPQPGVTVDSEGNEELAVEAEEISIPGATLSTPAPAVRQAVAANSACWSSKTHTNGSELGYLKLETGWWCGNGSSITSYEGPRFYAYDYVGNCHVNTSTSFTWLVAHSWLHMGIWTQYGWGIKGACEVWENLAATARTAANGYYDWRY